MSFALEASRAVEPYFYRAPHPADVTPYEYQFAGAEYALARDNCIVGDDPGLGKSCEAVLISNAIGAKWNLVVCPASLRLNWEREIWMWSTLEGVSTYPVLRSQDGVSNVANYVIISYDLLRNPSILNAIMDEMWDHLILDEAHYLKDPKGNQRTKVICAPDLLPSVCGRITLCTGTLLPNQPIEAYNAIRLTNWDAINRASLEDFRDFYYEAGGGMVRGPVWDEERQAFVNKLHWSEEVRNQPTNLKHFQRTLRRHIMVRRNRRQVLHELPPVNWHPFPLQSNTKVKAALKHPGWKQAEKLYELDPHAFDRSVPIDGEISTARRLLGEAKAPLAADYIDDLMNSGIVKLVVSAWHHTVLDLLKERLSKYGLTYMDGRTSPAKKQYAVDQFQQNKEVRIILGQMLPLGEGWTLTAAQDLVNTEPFWVPGKNDQLLLRINRPGQTGHYTLGHLPVVPGTLDERILGSAISKDINIHEALDAPLTADEG